MKMTFQALQTMFQIIVAAGIVMTAVGGYGTYYYGLKVNEQKENKTPFEKPFVDLCRRGIQVRQEGQDTLSFDVPYCAGRNANAYNVKLLNAVIGVNNNSSYILLSKFEDDWPDNVTLSYETGKSMQFSLSPMTFADLPHVYICVKGNFSDENGKHIYQVFDLFKYNLSNHEWVLLLGEENKKVKDWLLRSS